MQLEKKILRNILPFLFASVIFSTSDFLTIPHEDDIDLGVWEEVGTIDENFRQSIPATQNQTCKCGVGMSRLNFSTKIVGGVTSRNHAWPWAAAIVNINSSRLRAICSSSLIASQYLLTAGHCLETMKQNGLSNYRIYLGTNRVVGNTTKRVIARIGAIKIHPAYNSARLLNDIGLIRLASPVRFSSNVNPVCLSQTGSPFVGNDSIAQGWGDTQFGANIGSNSIREVHLKIITNAACQTTFNTVIASNICAQGPKKNICNGDSGGGLIIPRSRNSTQQIYTQIGISSFNRNCSLTTPAVFTRVKSYLSFIKFNLQNATYCSDTFG